MAMPVRVSLLGLMALQALTLPRRVRQLVSAPSRAELEITLAVLFQTGPRRIGP